MNILKREVLNRTTGDHLRDDIRFLDRFFAIGFVVSVIWAVSMTIGIRIGHHQACHETLMGSEPVIVENDACGISDPIACAVQIAEAVVVNPFRFKTVPSDAPYEKIIVQEDVTRIILRNLGDGKSRTFDFSRPITVVRTMCDDDGLLLECVQWTLPGARYIDRAIVWDMDVVSFVTAR